MIRVIVVSKNKAIYLKTIKFSAQFISVQQECAKINTLSIKKKKVKSDQFFSGDQYFSPANNFTRLKLSLTKNFYQLFFLLNKNQVIEILKQLSDLLYDNLVEWHWVGNGS